MTFLEFLAAAHSGKAVQVTGGEGQPWITWTSWDQHAHQRIKTLFDEARVRIKPIKHSVVVSKSAWDSFLACCPVAGRTSRPVSNPITVEWEE